MSVPRNGLISWLDKKIIDPLLQILRRDVEPKQLAFSASVGLTLGIFPICGVTVILCGVAIALLGSHCHSPTVLLANFVATPIELRYQMSVPRNGLISWLDKKIIDPLLQILRRDVEPKQLAFSASVGLTLGIFPICGVTVILCGVAIALLGSHCHSPTVLLANFVATPIELSLVVPFLRLGEAICGGPHFPLTSDALKKVLTGKASRAVLLSIVHVLFGWLLAAPLIMALLYVLLLPCFKLLVQKYGVVSSIPKMPSHADIKLKMRDV